MCDKMAIPAYILKVVEKDTFLRLQMRAEEMFNRHRKFINDYSLPDWSTLDNPSVSVNDHFDRFYEKTSTCIDSHVPKKRVTCTKRKLKLRNKLWINGEIQRLMTYRDKLLKKMINHPTSSNKYLYSKFRNCIVSEQHKGKIKYFQNYFEKHT